jgi:Fe-S cluster assembly protein SufD
MIAALPELENYALQLEKRGESLAGEPAWLASFRKKGMERFQDLGFPTTFHEEWKYTDVTPIRRTPFAAASYELDGITVDCLTKIPLCDLGDIRITLVNGFYSPELSRLEGLPSGVTVTTIAQALTTHGEIIQAHLGRYAAMYDHPYVALNSALQGEGIFIHVPRGKVVEPLIHALMVTTSTGEPAAAHPRILIVAEEESQATVVETYVGLTDDAYFTNAVVEIVVAERAHLDHYKVQHESEAAFHIATQQLEQSANSTFVSHSISLGAALARNDINNRLGGEHIESTINGLYLAGGRQHVDNHTIIDHAYPNCNSWEVYKGILWGRSTGVFNGKIFVRQDAQKTDSKQTNQNLLLSEDATINTKPQLEIYADDVRCTHGATVGQLDPNALFYLRARGIPMDEARSMLVFAFAGDLLTRIKPPRLREELETLLFARLGTTDQA